MRLIRHSRYSSEHYQHEPIQKPDGSAKPVYDRTCKYFNDSPYLACAVSITCNGCPHYQSILDSNNSERLTVEMYQYNETGIIYDFVQKTT